MAVQLVYLVCITVIMTMAMVEDVGAVRHCTYKFRVPASDMELSCPGLRPTELENEEEEEEEIDYTEEVIHLTKPPQTYYDKTMTGSGDFSDTTPAPTPPPHNRRHRRKPRRGHKRNNKTKRGQLTHTLQGGEPEPGYSAAVKQHTSTLRKTSDGAVMDGDTANQLLAGMAKLVNQNGIQADQAAANR